MTAVPPTFVRSRSPSPSPTPEAPAPVTFLTKLRDPVWQAYMLLRIVLTIAPLVFGIDKFFNLLTFWPKYLAPVATDLAPLDGQPFMFMVGFIEISLGLLVAVVPRYGAVLVMGWLSFIIVNLLLLQGFYDIALRDFGLLVAALVLFRLTFYRVPDPANSEQE